MGLAEYLNFDLGNGGRLIDNFFVFIYIFTPGSSSHLGALPFHVTC